MFTGTGIQWFGSMGPRHGIADMYIDGRFVQRVDAYARGGRLQFIDVDAFVVTTGVPHGLL
ncbi:hypothetical protein EDB83DRAFT_2458896 [Lactarius deliciosus]|nr:hypothetical protein EDB83DRAFT_2458896 [Lactarius deliciosus]